MRKYVCRRSLTPSATRFNSTWAPLLPGVAGFHICQAHMVDAKGEEIEAIQDYPVYKTEYYKNFPGVVS